MEAFFSTSKLRYARFICSRVTHALRRLVVNHPRVASELSHWSALLKAKFSICKRSEEPDLRTATISHCEDVQTLLVTITRS